MKLPSVTSETSTHSYLEPIMKRGASTTRFKSTHFHFADKLPHKLSLNCLTPVVLLSNKKQLRLS